MNGQTLEFLQATIGRNRKYLPIALDNVCQTFFLSLPHKEVLYGGAAGGGKSVGLLAAALMFVHVPGYSALLLRRNYSDLNLPRALIPLSHEWLDGTDATWSEDKHRWLFPSGATIDFGYLQSENDKYRYQSAGFQYIGFDELTQFSETQYRYLFSRLRRLTGMKVPLRMRSGTNPGGVGHEWVKKRFITARGDSDRLFVPAKLEDNPHLDAESYEESLKELDPVTRGQLRRGDWSITPEGEFFKAFWFDVVERPPRHAFKHTVRFWDLAATEPTKKNKDPDFTAGVLAGITEHGVGYVLDVQRFRETPSKTEKRIRQTANLDGIDVPIRIEREGGSSGKSLISHYMTNVLPGYDVRGIPPATDKVSRAAPLAAAAERNEWKLCRGVWVPDLLDELNAFPNPDVHDDQVDAFSGAFRYLTRRLRGWDGVTETSEPKATTHGVTPFHRLKMLRSARRGRRQTTES